MTWTYGPDYSTDRDVIRDLIWDTDSATPLVTDEQIGKYTTGGVLAQANVYLAAAMLAEDIANSLSRNAKSLSAGGTSVTFRDPGEYTSLAKRLRMRSAGQGGASVFAGGISQSSKDGYTDDTDNLVPAFTRRQGDPPNTYPLTRDELGYG